MKKIILLFVAVFVLSLLFGVLPQPAHAQAADICDESKDAAGKPSGLVPCGKMCVKDDLKTAVPCGEKSCGTNGNQECYKLKCACDLPHIFILIKNLYVFIVWKISFPLAALLMVIGGILMILGGANPNLHARGKSLLWAAIWALLIIIGSYVIVGGILFAIGYRGTWFTFEF